MSAILQRLRQPGIPTPQPPTGALAPIFLGLILTRGCRMACRYCDFVPAHVTPRMPLELARQAIDSYFDLLVSQGQRHAEVHFFGGEPFDAADIVHFSVAYARLRAAERGMHLSLEAATNGFYSERLCRWIASQFDTIILSLDGPAEIQDSLRPDAASRGTSKIVERSAHIFSDSDLTFHIRACVTQDTVARLPEIAAWIADEFTPDLVCFESLTPSPRSRQAELRPPDPWLFAQAIYTASRILDPLGIQTVLSTANIHNCQASFCPVGKDVIIVSPDGMLSSCYLLEQDWKSRGLDMRLGRIDGNGFEIDESSCQHLRQFSIHAKSRCVDCFCRYHCAGGCHVNHPSNVPPATYDDLCVQTRLVSAVNLLKDMNQADLVSQFLADRSAMERLARQPTDRLEALQ
ncbi:MAG: radical SAM protein [Anaerolineales bacterium]|nr:radical SAM protein [Anaerolineales bacterium]